MGKAPTAWPAETRTAAMAYAQQHGNAAAGRKFGVPRQTVTYWMSHAGIEPGTSGAEGRTAKATEAARRRREYLRERLRLRLLEEANWALDRIHKPHVEFKGDRGQKVTYPVAPASAVQAYATTAGILIDKYRLEIGEATTRNEHRDLTHDDHETEVFRDVIRAELARRHAESARAAHDRTAETRTDAPAVEADAAVEPGTPVG